MAGTALGARDTIVNQTDTAVPFPVRGGVGSEFRPLGCESWLHHLLTGRLGHIFDVGLNSSSKMEIMMVPTSKGGEN